MKKATALALVDALRKADHWKTASFPIRELPERHQMQDILLDKAHTVVTKYQRIE
jgi:hypothetical protein